MSIFIIFFVAFVVLTVVLFCGVKQKSETVNRIIGLQGFIIRETGMFVGIDKKPVEDINDYVCTDFREFTNRALPTYIPCIISEVYPKTKDEEGRVFVEPLDIKDETFELKYIGNSCQVWSSKTYGDVFMDIGYSGKNKEKIQLSGKFYPAIHSSVWAIKWQVS
ncbi:MAG: hypothetical protein IJ019_06795 [Alphaproteobacteria bacterium]|nr:hypothetical protein [Alphaproteobacteria bacterium]